MGNIQQSFHMKTLLASADFPTLRLASLAQGKPFTGLDSRMYFCYECAAFMGLKAVPANKLRTNVIIRSVFVFVLSSITGKGCQSNCSGWQELHRQIRIDFKGVGVCGRPIVCGHKAAKSGDHRAVIGAQLYIRISDRG